METTLPRLAPRSESSVLRLVDGFLDPRAAFDAISRRPTFLAPLAALAAARLARVFAFYHPSLLPWKLLLTCLVEVLPTLLVIGVATLVLTGALSLTGADARMQRVFSVLLHTFLVYTVLTLGWRLVEVLLVPAQAGQYHDPRFSNLGFLVSEQDFALQRLASAVDVLVFYHLFLISLGLSRVTREVSFARCLAVVVGTWTALIGVEVAIKVAVS